MTKFVLVYLDMADSKLSAFFVSMCIEFYFLAFGQRCNSSSLKGVPENADFPRFTFVLYIAKPLLCIIEFHCPIYHRRVPLLAEEGEPASAVKSKEYFLRMAAHDRLRV